MLEELVLTVGILLLFHVTIYYTNTDLMPWIKKGPLHYFFPEEDVSELDELKEQLEKKINEYKNA
jgi:predicted nucleic acid-binding protein